MKKQWLIGVAVAAGLALTGCSKSTCDDLADTDAQVEEKYSPCREAGETVEKFNVNQCEANVDKCTDAETDALADYAECARKLPDCSPATQESFNNAVTACYLSAQGKIGATCLEAVFGD